MLMPEQHPLFESEVGKNHQYKVGNTVVTVTSECMEEPGGDILDALVRLMKRDIAGVETD